MNRTTSLPSVASPCTRALAVHMREYAFRYPARMYVRGRIFWCVVVCMCTRFRRDSLNCYVGGSTMTCAATYSATVHRCRATDRSVCTYTFATRQTTLRTLRPGGSQLSGRIRTYFLACEDIAAGSQLSGGGIIFLPVIRTHFLACEDVAGGSQLSGGENIIFQGKKDAVACMRPWVWCVPTVNLSRTVIFR
jgi:hypothetical protein